MATGTPVTYADFRGGVNAQSGEYLLAENELLDARNYHTTRLGSLKKRNGFVTFDSTTTLTSRLDSIHSLYPVNTATKSLIGVGKQAGASNDRIVTINTGGTAATLKSSLTQGLRWSFVQAPISLPGTDQGPIYGVNGTDTPQQWDGAAATTTDWTANTGTVPSSAKFLNYHTDRIWATGSSTYPGRVWYSGLTADTVPAPDPGVWDTDGYVDIEPQDGETITGIGNVGPDQVVFKARQAYAITDPVSGAWRMIGQGVGCIAHRSIVETPRGTIFLSEDAGVCITDGSTIQRIGGNIEPFIRQAAEDNPTALPNAAGVLHQNSYYLSIPYASTTNDLLLEYDLEAESWWVHTSTCASNQFALLDPVGTPKLYSAYPATTRVHRAFTPDVFMDNGAAYASCYAITAYLPFGQPHLVKRMAQVRIDGNGAYTLASAENFTDNYEAKDGEAWETTDSGGVFGVDGTFGDSEDFGPDPGVTETRFYTLGVGRAWSFKIANADTLDNEIFSLTAFVRGRTD